MELEARSNLQPKIQEPGPAQEATTVIESIRADWRAWLDIDMSGFAPGRGPLSKAFPRDQTINRLFHGTFVHSAAASSDTACGWWC